MRPPWTPLPRRFGAYSDRSIHLSHSITRWLVHRITSSGQSCCDPWAEKVVPVRNVTNKTTHHTYMHFKATPVCYWCFLKTTHPACMSTCLIQPSQCSKCIVHLLLDVHPFYSFFYTSAWVVKLATPRYYFYTTDCARKSGLVSLKLLRKHIIVGRPSKRHSVAIYY